MQSGLITIAGGQASSSQLGVACGHKDAIGEAVGRAAPDRCLEQLAKALPGRAMGRACEDAVQPAERNHGACRVATVDPPTQPRRASPTGLPRRASPAAAAVRSVPDRAADPAGRPARKPGRPAVGADGGRDDLHRTSDAEGADVAVVVVFGRGAAHRKLQQREVRAVQRETVQRDGKAAACAGRA